MKEPKRKNLFLGFGVLIIIFSGIFIILSIFQVNYQQTILDKQKQIIDENRHWAEKITFWEVTGGLGEDIIEGEKIYYDALSRYSTALQAQTIAILFIIVLSIIMFLSLGFLIVKIF